MIVLAAQAGLRISELAGLTAADVVLGAGAHVHTVGKGRKERRTPLLPATVAVLRAWITERHGAAADPLFPPVRQAAQPRRDRAADHPARQQRRPGLPVAAIQARNGPHAQT